MIGIRWKIIESNSTITGIVIKVQNYAEIKSINITNITSVQCEAWPLYLCYNITNLKHNTRYTVSVEIFSEEFPEGGSHKSIQVVTRESIPEPISDIKVDEISDNYFIVSWRIPYLLNGILRKFLIEVEHISSFDESLCCQTIQPINHVVTEDKETYSHKIENIMNASSYQVTVRAFTRRLGPGVSTIIDVPPPILPFRKKPTVTVNDEEVDWEDTAKEPSRSPNTRNELMSDVLVIVRSDSQNSKANESSPLRNDLQQHLQYNDWWLAYVCSANEDCSVKIGNEEKSNSSYGEIDNKPLILGDTYTIILAQVNKYLSAKSFTIVKSVQFEMKEKSLSISTTTETLLQSTLLNSVTVESTAVDIEQKVVEEPLEQPQTKDEDIIDSADPPEPLDYDYNNPV
ncbi:hypothetical protein WDU94_000861 [Cyamophila willieti]